MERTSPIIRFENVTRTFRVAERTTGFAATLRSMVHRKYETINAIRDISFTASSGEVLGILGSNGSGKTTMLKCVAGLLTPSLGRVDVLGFLPHERPTEFLCQLAFVMGQRSQLHQDVAVLDSFDLRRVVYGLTMSTFTKSRDELIDLLGLGSFAATPVRQLSLGQRMRCELAVALLHRPRLVLLDEPTIGLDFDAQNSIRMFVRHYVQEHDATVLLTSHYLQDIEALANRVVVLVGGRLAFTGSLQGLRDLDSGRQVLTLRGDGIEITTTPWKHLITTCRPNEITFNVPKGDASAILAQLSALPGITGIALSDPPLETALSSLYASIERT